MNGDGRCPLCGGRVRPAWDETHHATCGNCGARIAAVATPRARICRRPGCITRLGVRNPGPFCLIHTPDATSSEYPARLIVRRMGDRFVRGYPAAYPMTPDERRRYARGEW